MAVAFFVKEAAIRYLPGTAVVKDLRSVIRGASLLRGDGGGWSRARHTRVPPDAYHDGVVVESVS